MLSDRVSYYEVRAKSYTYILRTTIKYSRAGLPISVGLDLGGKMKGCVRVTVELHDKDNEQHPILKKLEERKKYAFILWIGYNPKCSVTADFPSGRATRHMVCTAMNLVINSFAHIDGFSLTDASNVPCGKDIDVSLANLSVATNGQTYYEKYFSAYLEKPTTNNEYKLLASKIFDPKEKMSFHKFVKFMDHDIPEETVSIIRPIYEKSTTMMHFFLGCLERLSQEQSELLSFCVSLARQVHRFSPPARPKPILDNDLADRQEECPNGND